jgi:catechol 2,3-dioxygenase-like lactoylglutathione lyase family enzyme
MINGIDIVSVWVLDQDSAKEFYTEKLGFELTTDIKLDNGMRWLTVQPPGNTGQNFLLMDPSHSMLDEQTAAAVRGLVAKGALSPGVMATSDCRGDYEALVKRGVEFTSPPAERPYGIEAILRDDSGNWFSFTERKQQWSLPIGRRPGLSGTACAWRPPAWLAALSRVISYSGFTWNTRLTNEQVSGSVDPNARGLERGVE